MKIQFRDKDTEEFAHGRLVRRLQGVPRKPAEAKIARLIAAEVLYELRNPPGNYFEALHGDREGQYSIRINSKWRICFEWDESSQKAFNIEIVDYHR